MAGGKEYDSQGGVFLCQELKLVNTNEVIWEALGENTCDLDSIWEETGQDYNFTRSGFKNARIVPGDGVASPSDAIRTYKRQRQKLCDGVIT
ncbi:hypothetical protein Tco_0535254 [Tanacetum coccineum]